jgi:hypothetical protein
LVERGGVGGDEEGLEVKVLSVHVDVGFSELHYKSAIDCSCLVVNSDRRETAEEVNWK